MMKKTSIALLLVCGLNATAQASSLALGVHAPVTVIETRAQSILAEEHKMKAREAAKHQHANQQDGVSKLFKQLKAFMAKAISE